VPDLHEFGSTLVLAPAPLIDPLLELLERAKQR
jgi:hypothetical protein